MQTSDRGSLLVRCSRNLLAVSFIVLGTVAIALTCGPGFPLDFLRSRESVLLQAPDANFAQELGVLVPRPTDAPLFRVVEDVDESTYDLEDEESSGGTTVAEHEDLPPEAVTILQQMRRLENGQDAYAAGQGLPLDVRWYTAGAVSFHNKQLELAQSQFEAVLKLPKTDRARRELWARFMLGRVAALRGDTAAAVDHFAEVRALVRAGSKDTLGLAVASLGEEARLHLQPGGIARAINLYAQQASYGSPGAIVSLVRVAQRTLRNDEWLNEAVRDNLARRLLLLCLHASSDIYMEWEDEPALDSADATTGIPAERGDPPTVFERVIHALERNNITDAAGSDWLAAMAYNHGRFDLAERFAARDTTPVSAWMQAKLAWRRGDMTTVLAKYSEALSGFRRAERTGENVARLQAEMALVHLGRDEYSRALELFFSAARMEWKPESFSMPYWTDVAYLAERVMTVTELKRFVDDHFKAPTASELDEMLEKGERIPGSGLRGLLARRLTREGQHREAIAYFDDEHLRSVAEEYAAALSKASSRWRSDVDRAEAWFSAATIARFDGMELMGMELSPDYAIVGGQFELNDSTADIDDPELQPELETPMKDTEQPSSRESNATQSIGRPTNQETARVKTSAPNPNVRFHYRLTAVGHAMQSADLLPRSSQAFAAVLCRAAGWILGREPEQAAVIYRRYLAEGPYVPWARYFGRRCPQPDFESAARQVWTHRVNRTLDTARAHPVVGLSLSCAAIGLAILGIRVTRKNSNRPIFGWMNTKALSFMRRRPEHPTNIVNAPESEPKDI